LAVIIIIFFIFPAAENCESNNVRFQQFLDNKSLHN